MKIKTVETLFRSDVDAYVIAFPNSVTAHPVGDGPVKIISGKRLFEFHSPGTVHVMDLDENMEPTFSHSL